MQTRYIGKRTYTTTNSWVQLALSSWTRRRSYSRSTFSSLWSRTKLPLIWWGDARWRLLQGQEFVNRRIWKMNDWILRMHMKSSVAHRTSTSLKATDGCSRNHLKQIRVSIRTIKKWKSSLEPTPKTSKKSDPWSTFGAKNSNAAPRMAMLQSRRPRVIKQDLAAIVRAWHQTLWLWSNYGGIWTRREPSMSHKKSLCTSKWPQ